MRKWRLDRHNLTYLGKVLSYSETEEIKEIVLTDVTVYSYETSEKLYDIDRIYLALAIDDVIIENAKSVTT